MIKLHFPYIILGILLLTACNLDNRGGTKKKQGNTTTNAPALQQKQGIEVGGTMMVDTNSIAENMLNSNDHTTFTKAATATGLIGTLNGPGPFTVFAPTNEAFNKLPAGMVDDLLLPGRKQDLVNLLNYHIVHGAFKSSDLKDGMELKTTEGKILKVSQQNGKWHINNATVTIPNILSNNGVTYVIDAVMVPER